MWSGVIELGAGKALMLVWKGEEIFTAIIIIEDSVPGIVSLICQTGWSGFQVRTSDHTPLLTCLLEGPAGAGKTALAATLGLESEYPFVKIVSSDNMVGYSEQAKAGQIAKVFEDAYRVRFPATHMAPQSAVSFSVF